jgi:CRISPR-associated endonuclease Cas1
MAATQTVPQLSSPSNSNGSISLAPRHGVITVFGFGVAVYVDRGHLIIRDGIGVSRSEVRLPRVGHRLRRLVVVSSDGMISLAAIRWLSAQDIGFLMLNRDGTVLAVTGPVRPSDARLRRAQALAHQTGIAMQIARELIARKLAGQEQLVREKLRDSSTADVIAQARAALKLAGSIVAIRQLEAHAAHAYWSAWRTLPINFPQRDLDRVPDHWRTFGTRKSPLTGSPRLAVNPPNAMLNYLYALLESESRLALAALGLDPGIGVLHVDTPVRDSLACDLMEAVRPHVDAYVFDWISLEPLRREWFFEQRDGSCRLMGGFAVRLSETASTWGHAVAPAAEWVSRALWSTLRKPARQVYPATRLTQSRRRQAKGGPPVVPDNPAPKVPRVCRTCGELLKHGKTYCVSCSVSVSRANLIEAAKLGRIETHRPKAEALRAATQRRHVAERKAWQPAENPHWLTKEAYRERIQPRLAGITVPTISAALGISEPYATDIRAGRRVPHPRHWLMLAKLAGVKEAAGN